MIIAVTGTSRGIGKALAAHFAARGDRVFGCSRGALDLGRDGYTHVIADLTTPGGIKGFFGAIRRQAGSLDALINSAGTSTMNHFMLMPEETTRAIFDLNVHALLGCCREAAPLLMKSEHPAPSILSLSSVAVPWALEGQLAYAASKSAVEQITRGLSKELASERIRVNAVGLPPIRTALTRTVPKEKISALIARQTIRRQCEVDDIIGPIEFLISEQARFVTGETLHLGGVH